MILSRIAQVTTVIRLLGSCKCSHAWENYIQGRWHPDSNDISLQGMCYGSLTDQNTSFGNTRRTKRAPASFTAAFLKLAESDAYDMEYKYDGKPKTIHYRQFSINGVHRHLQVCIDEKLFLNLDFMWTAWAKPEDGRCIKFWKNIFETLSCTIGQKQEPLVVVRFGKSDLGKHSVFERWCETSTCACCGTAEEFNVNDDDWELCPTKLNMPTLFAKLFSLKDKLQNYHACSCLCWPLKSDGDANCWSFADEFQKLITDPTEPSDIRELIEFQNDVLVERNVYEKPSHAFYKHPETVVIQTTEGDEVVTVVASDPEMVAIRKARSPEAIPPSDQDDEKAQPDREPPLSNAKRLYDAQQSSKNSAEEQATVVYPGYEGQDVITLDPASRTRKSSGSSEGKQHSSNPAADTDAAVLATAEYTESLAF